MNREQAREIARKAFLKWQNEGEIGWGADAISDALHAVYEAERAKPTQPRIVQHECPGEYPEDECPQDSLHNELAVRAEKIRELESRIASIRLSSIKETARGSVTTGYSNLDAAFALAESFESAFERRYGGKP